MLLWNTDELKKIVTTLEFEMLRKSASIDVSRYTTKGGDPEL
jgi:hypothetical protein